MNINELTALFQQHLRDEGISEEELLGDQSNYGYVYMIHWNEEDLVWEFGEFLKQMIKEGLIEIIK